MLVRIRVGTFDLHERRIVVIDECGVVTGPERRVSLETLHCVTGDNLRVRSSSAVDVHAVAGGEGVLHVAAVGLVDEVDLAFLDELEEIAALLLAHRQRTVDDEFVHPFPKKDRHFRRHHAAGVVAEYVGLFDAQMVEHGWHCVGPVTDRGARRA